MLFNSYLFILCFLPLCIIGYFSLNHFHSKAGLAFLVGMSLWFYGYFNPIYLFVIVTSILVNYVLTVLMHKSPKQPYRMGLLGLGIFLNLRSLFYFKYFDFFLDNYKKVDCDINPVVGEYDAPNLQKQGLLTLPITRGGNWIIYGMADSGKEDMINALVYSCITTYSPMELISIWFPPTDPNLPYPDIHHKYNFP